MKKLSKSLSIALICLFISLSFIGCDNNDDGSCLGTFCQGRYSGVTVSLQDQNENAIFLDSYELIDLKDNTPITLSLNSAFYADLASRGNYMIMDNATFEQVGEINIQFIGYINNQEVVRKNYSIAGDCCSVSLISGERSIEL